MNELFNQWDVVVILLQIIAIDLLLGGEVHPANVLQVPSRRAHIPLLTARRPTLRVLGEDGEPARVQGPRRPGRGRPRPGPRPMKTGSSGAEVLLLCLAPGLPLVGRLTTTGNWWPGRSRRKLAAKVMMAWLRLVP